MAIDMALRYKKQIEATKSFGTLSLHRQDYFRKLI